MIQGAYNQRRSAGLSELVVIVDNQLSFFAHVAGPCRFFIYNTEDNCVLVQLLVILNLDFKSVLAVLSISVKRSLQLIQTRRPKVFTHHLVAKLQRSFSLMVLLESGLFVLE